MKNKSTFRIEINTVLLQMYQFYIITIWQVAHDIAIICVISTHTGNEVCPALSLTPGK